MAVQNAFRDDPGATALWLGCPTAVYCGLRISVANHSQSRCRRQNHDSLSNWEEGIVVSRSIGALKDRRGLSDRCHKNKQTKDASQLGWLLGTLPLCLRSVPHLDQKKDTVKTAAPHPSLLQRSIQRLASGQARPHLQIDRGGPCLLLGCEQLVDETKGIFYWNQGSQRFQTRTPLDQKFARGERGFAEEARQKRKMLVKRFSRCIEAKARACGSGTQRELSGHSSCGKCCVRDKRT